METVWRYVRYFGESIFQSSRDGAPGGPLKVKNVLGRISLSSRTAFSLRRTGVTLKSHEIVKLKKRLDYAPRFSDADGNHRAIHRDQLGLHHTQNEFVIPITEPSHCGEYSISI